MLGFITNWALKKANKIIDSRPPDFVIGPKEDPYMLRWWAIPRNKYFNIYLHKIRHDDDDRALHDHPWPSLSLCVSGTMIEHYTSPNGAYPRKREISAGEWIYRGQNFAHRLCVKQPVQDDIITIFMTGPRVREWGFHCPNGWRHWKDFVNQENKGEQGVGCGEVGITNDEGVFNDFHCRECGHGEIQLHNYDGFCRKCVEFSSYKREPKDWTLPVTWIAAFVIYLTIWYGIYLWWIS